MAYSEQVIDHYENPRNVGKMDAKDNVYPRKEFPENKIDGAVAAIMAVAQVLGGALIVVSLVLLQVRRTRRRVPAIEAADART